MVAMMDNLTVETAETEDEVSEGLEVALGMEIEEVG